MLQSTNHTNRNSSISHFDHAGAQLNEQPSFRQVTDTTTLFLLDHAFNSPNVYSGNTPRSVETLPPPPQHNLDWLVDLEDEEEWELEAGTDSGRGASVFTT